MKIPPAVGIDRDFWAGRRVLLTGHTGFKGAWLSLWLQSLDAELTGLAPGPPTSPSLYELAEVGAHMKEHALDVRDAQDVCDALASARPQVVLHLAAQPMVRRSLQQPALTYAVNVMGTVNVLEGVRVAAPDAQAVIVVTSDKCYEQPSGRVGGGPAGAAPPRGPDRPFVEGDRLGGADPYSSSKACAELVSAAYRRTYFTTGEDGGPTATAVATARAGNVIGGGDWGRDRLVADVARAVEAGEVLRVRSPDAVRPWQHVLNPLYGYLRLTEELSRGAHAARAWNFGPPAGEARPVSWVVSRLAELWQGALRWEVDDRRHPVEAARLEIDSSAAESELGWLPGWSLEEGLGALVDWHEALRADRDIRAFSLEQIGRFGHAIA